MTPRLFFLLGIAQRAVQCRTGKASRLGLSGSQAGVLFHSVRPEGATIGDVANGIGATASSMTELIDRMAALGLVKRSTDPADGRVQQLTLTDAGQEAREEARGRALTSLSELDTPVTDGFSTDDITIVARGSETVRSRPSHPVERTR